MAADRGRGRRPRETVYACDPTAAELEALTLTLGEGPGVDAVTGGPVLAGDLTSAQCATRWPAFAPAAVDAGATAVFALPLQVGGIRLGVMDLYRTRPGPLHHDELADALLLADIACALLLESGRNLRTAQAAGLGGESVWCEDPWVSQPRHRYGAKT
jgi:hypothetical protein